MNMRWIIYKHTSKTTGLSYVGQTRTTIKHRWNRHVRGAIRKHNKMFTDFAKAIREYGEKDFVHEILEENLETQEVANEREQYWISYFDTFQNGYNMTTGGQEFIDIRFSDEMKQKISIANTGKPLSEEHKTAISISNKGKIRSIEHCKKISEAKLGKPSGRKGQQLTKEHKQNISKSQRGKKLSEEHKKKISDNSQHKPHTEEFKEYLREINTGINNPNYGKLGKDNPNYGSKRTEEQKQRMSEAQKLSHAKKREQKKSLLK